LTDGWLRPSYGVMTKRMFAALLCASLAAPALAASSKPAPVSALVKSVKIPYKQFTLKNGLRVVVHTDRKAPLIAVSVWYGVGSKHEPKGKTGFAHLFEHLMFNGSENAPGDFFEPLAQIGATDFNGTTFFDRTNYFQTVPKNALDRTLFLESDRMGYLLGAVTQEKLDNQRGVVQNEKRQGDNQPYGMGWYATLAGLFPEGHPYHHSTIGSMADLDAARLDDVRTWFRDNYGPNNAVLVLAGDIDVKTAKAATEKWFGAIPRGPAIKDVTAAVPTLDAPKEKVLKDKVATTRITRMWAIPGETNADATALAAGAAVLGGLSSSRLDNALVRSEKIAASVSASANLFEDVGIYFVSADVLPGIDPAVTGARLDAVIADFLRDGPTADELMRVNTSSISGIISGLESVGGFGGKATTLAEGALYRNDPGAYRKDLRELAKLTPAKVRDTTRKWLSRPVYTLKTVPGEREAEGGGGAAKGSKAAPFPSAFFYADPKEPVSAKVAPGPDRSKLPDVGEFPTLDFPTIERATLKNGIPVFFAKRDAVPKVNVSISFDAGFTADPRDALGTQALMLGVIDEGTTTRNSIQIAEESERLGTGISKGASLDRTSFSMTALTPNLGPSLALMADIVRNPAFDPKEVERVRAQQLTAIASELTRPAALAARVLPEKLFGAAHPYGIPGTGTGDPKVVKALTPDQLRAFHRRWIRSDNARIIVTGNTSLPQLLPLLEASFGNWAQDRPGCQADDLPDRPSGIAAVDHHRRAGAARQRPR
jgi:zinc protease